MSEVTIQNSFATHAYSRVVGAAASVAGAASKGASKVTDTASRANSAVGNAVTSMESVAENKLNGSYAKMSEFSIAKIQPRVSDTDSRVSYLKARNAMARVHETIVTKGESLSRKAGYFSYKAVRLALTPLSFFNVGAALREAVALSVGFAVRGVFTALSQLAHVVPYAAVAAGATAAGLGFYALAKASPLAGVAVAGAVMLVALQAQVAHLANKAHQTKNDVREQGKAHATALQSQAKADEALESRMDRQGIVVGNLNERVSDLEIAANRSWMSAITG
ncbi:MAG: hypothetical protein KR126chlam1_00414 [Chlamydiae bacterium]|nr:hypothetical protein [Chlamydiota bacterium]